MRIIRALRTSGGGHEQISHGSDGCDGDAFGAAGWLLALPTSATAQSLAALGDAKGPPKANNPQPLAIPPDLPGSEAPPIRLPPTAPGTPEAQRRASIEQLYEALPPMLPGGARRAARAEPAHPGRFAADCPGANPLIQQAASDVTAAEGAAIQAGAYPNPHVAWEADNMNTGRTDGYQGVNVGQTVVTGGKLRLGVAAANVDLANAQLRAPQGSPRPDYPGRGNYLAVLVALERMRINRALADFADGVYHTQIRRVVTAGEAAPYEPLQLRVLSMQARTTLLQSQHDYESAWCKLAASLDCPDMPPTALAGRLDVPVPQINYETAKQRLLQNHTDLITAQNAVAKARYLLQLARVTPWIPNVDVSTVIQKDYTTPPFGTTVNMNVGAPLPLFDRNRGNIMSAEAALLRATREYERARNDLFATLADVFARYQTSGQTFEYYRSIVTDQVRAYRAIFRRYQYDPDNVGFNDLVTAQQTVAGVIATYAQTLGDQWQAVSDLAGTLQEDDMFKLGRYARVILSAARNLAGIQANSAGL